MELYQLRTFLAVAEEGNFTRAGQRVHATQPAVSGHIKALEDELGVALFLRTPRGVELTGAGRELAEEARKVVAAAESLIVRAKALKGDVAGSLSVGLCTEPGYLRVDELLVHMADRYPGVALNLVQCPSGVVLRDLASRELDAGFVFFGASRPGLSSLVLARPDYYVAGAAQWAELLADGSPEALSSLAWVMPTQACAFRSLLQDILASNNITPVRTIGADSEEVIRQLVVTGKALSLMRDDEVRELEAKGRVVAVKGLGAYPSELNFLSQASRGDDPAVRALIAGVRAVWNLEG